MGVGFLFTELDAGMVFAKLALDARDRDKRKRNVGNAEAAYKSLLKFLPRVELTDTEREELESGLANLRSTIDSVPMA